MSLQNYPDWLGSMLLTGNLPWDDMAKSSMHEFLVLFTLHDSYFVTLHIAPGHIAVAVMRWYMRLEMPVFNPPMRDKSYAFLLIYFPSFYQIRMGQDAITFPYEIGEVKCSILTDEQRLAILNAELLDPFHEDSTFEFLLEPPLCRSTFISVENTRFDLTHGESVYFVCLDDDKQTHSIPRLTRQ
ncbi:MAG: hypothetical protein ABI947_11205 [Chloroflexota bacterium]